MRHRPGSSQELDKSLAFIIRDVRAELWVREGAAQLSEQVLRDDELEIPIEPASEQACGGAGGCQERGNQNVGVENGSQSLPAARPRSVLSFDGEPHSIILVHTVLIPEPLEEVEAEIATKRLLDDLAVPLSLTGRPHSDPAEYVFVERYGRPYLPHLCIIAYRCICSDRTAAVLCGPRTGPPYRLTQPSLSSRRCLSPTPDGWASKRVELSESRQLDRAPNHWGAREPTVDRQKGGAKHLGQSNIGCVIGS